MEDWVGYRLWRLFLPNFLTLLKLQDRIYFGETRSCLGLGEGEGCRSECSQSLEWCQSRGMKHILAFSCALIYKNFLPFSPSSPSLSLFSLLLTLLLKNPTQRGSHSRLSPSASRRLHGVCGGGQPRNSRPSRPQSPGPGQGFIVFWLCLLSVLTPEVSEAISQLLLVGPGLSREPKEVKRFPKRRVV